jgi:hypothetical protein
MGILLGRSVLVVVMLLGCAAKSEDDDSASSTSSEDGADTASSSGTDPSATTTSGADTSTGGTTSVADESESTGAPLHACGLEDLKPGEADPIQSGTGQMQIPPDIAAIQLANCGCHLADDLTVEAPDYPSTGPFDMTTWDGFQAIRPSDRMPYHAIAHTYVESGFMPLSTYCNLGGGENITPEDRATLVEWLSMGAPDGATWVP